MKCFLALAASCCLTAHVLGDEFGNFIYIDHGSSIEITGYAQDETVTVVIPASINGKPVTRIGDNAFRGCGFLTGITIPSTVTSIGYCAFCECNGLTSLTIPSSVTTIGDYAFQFCSSLTNFTIPSSVTSIGEGLFSGCHGLTSVTLPSSVTSIRMRSFFDCGGLTSFTIPASVTSIGDEAFSYCNGLTSVTIPASVSSIGTGVFSPCTGLVSITVEAGNPDYMSLDGVLFNKLQTMLIQFPGGLTGSYTVPSPVINIADAAFRSCGGLTSLSLPASLVGIGGQALSGCGGLANITLPATVTSIGNEAFSYCRGLASITVETANSAYSSLDGVLFNKLRTVLIQFPAGVAGGYTIPPTVATIGNSAFLGCDGLSSVTIPVSVTSIGDSAFSYCDGLTSVTIPSSVTTIGHEAFSGCSGLAGVIIPSSVTSIGAYAYGFCDEMTCAIFTGDEPIMDTGVFDSTAPAFSVYYFDDAAGFASPVWVTSAGDSYPAINMGAKSPIKPWLVANGLPYDSDPKSDANGDGVNLLMAYALALDPNKNLAGSMPLPVFSGNQMSLSFHSISEGITYAVQTSADLQTWTNEGVSITEPDGAGIRTATVEMNGPKRFLRLSVKD